MRKKILVTGGPVHAYLDAVKIITNRFRGGRMAELAWYLARDGADVIYLSSKDGVKPKELWDFGNTSGTLECLEHDGFESYRETVCRLAQTQNAVVLGAAVANLIPMTPIKGKFPSHNYQVGDRIPIDFTIAPRVINEVKQASPNVHLFGFKLLQGVTQEELIDAAYDIVLDARATAVFANDANDLDQKFAVTKERGVHPIQAVDLPKWIMQMVDDKYYRTASTTEFFDGLNCCPQPDRETVEKFLHLIRRNSHLFIRVKDLVFGTVAVRILGTNAFMTTQRGKNEVEKSTVVAKVDHRKRVVYTMPETRATLNAPLLDKILVNKHVDTILHLHAQRPDLETQPYAPPGTVRDADREVDKSFNIEGHGCMLLFDKDGQVIK